MRRIFLMLLLAAASGNAMAEWVFVSGDKATKGYADPETIRKAGNIAKMWTLYNFQNHSSKLHEEFDCKEEQTRQLYAVYYKGQMGSGNLWPPPAVDPLDWRPVIPGTIGQDMWKLACGK